MQKKIACLRVGFFCSITILLLPLKGFASAPVLKIESDLLLKTVINEMETTGSAPEAYFLSEKYRVDLTLMDLVDQVTLASRKQKNYLERLKSFSNDWTQFQYWFSELRKIASSDLKFRKKLDQDLRVQYYAKNGQAISPHYKFIDLNKIKDNALLVRIHRYNEIASDAESGGLLKTFERLELNSFSTRPLTVAKLEVLTRKKIRQVRANYYARLIGLYQKHDPSTLFLYKPRRGKLKAIASDYSYYPEFKIFNAIARVPNKQDILSYVKSQVPSVPEESGLIVLTPTFIRVHFKEVEPALKKYTQLQMIQSHGDEYLLELRKWIKAHANEIDRSIQVYNDQNRTAFVLFYKDRSKLPKRVEALLDNEILTLVFPEFPWMKSDHGTLINWKGREVFFDSTGSKRIGRFIAGVVHKVVQPETYLSLIGGTVATFAAQGNVAIGLVTQKVVRDFVKMERYDREFKEFLSEVPSDVLSAFLLGSGLYGGGRLYKVIALGAGQGGLQSLMTGQDLFTGASVGAAFNLLQYYVLPLSFAKPMVKGFDAHALAVNRRLELLEKTVRASLQGAVVAALTEESIGRGALKAAAYGFISTELLIWFLGTRYYPFKNYPNSDIDQTIAQENAFQNQVGRGGLYEINRQLILDANYRVGGALAPMIHASITLPGNVTMSNQGFHELNTVTHEASHLMQHHQSGVYGFYLFRYIPTVLKTGYQNSPDENFLKDVAASLIKS